MSHTPLRFGQVRLYETFSDETGSQYRKTSGLTAVSAQSLQKIHYFDYADIVYAETGSDSVPMGATHQA